MKDNEPVRNVTESEAFSSGNFGLSASNHTHLMVVLRDSLYSDKILAVLREYSSNAWDANKVVGKGAVPIRIHIPTYEDPTLTIRDFGPGLSESDIYEVYTQYGSSTKRNDDTTVGHLGLGSKSAFCYSDSFNVTSWHGGKKCVYTAVLDASNVGKMSKVWSGTQDSSEPDGVEISIAVKKSDISLFERKAKFLFEHFDPRPEINIELPAIPAEIIRLTNGSIVTGTEKADDSYSYDDSDSDEDEPGEWVAVMGCVPYRINLSQIDPARLNRSLRKMRGTIRFKIGEVQFSANREELKYSDLTKVALADKFDALIDEFVLNALSIMDSNTLTAWEKRMRIRVLRDLDLSIPDMFESWGTSRVTLVDPGVTKFSLIHNKAAVGSVTVTSKLRFIIRDTDKSLKGFQLHTDDYVVKGHGTNEKASTKIREELDVVLAATNLTGVPVLLLSSLPTQYAPSRSGGTKNLKHKQQFFVLKPPTNNYFKSPYSQYWEAVDRVPEETDVFVIIENFKAYDNFQSDYIEDRKLANELDEEAKLPTVYAYKSTEKKPKDIASCTGMEYRDWRKLFVKELMTPKRKCLLDANSYIRGKTLSGSYSKPDGRRTNALRNFLGADHPLMLLQDREDAYRALVGDTDAYVLANLRLRSEHPSVTFDDEVEAFLAKYPLFQLNHDRAFSALWYSGYNDDGLWKNWADYIHMIDARENAKVSVDNKPTQAHLAS